MFRRFWNRRETSARHQRRQNNRNRQAHFESLESREVPAVLFSPTSGAPTVSDGGGMVMKDTPVYLIYWGSAWGNPGSGPSMSSINAATQSMLSGPYLSALSQYRTGLGTAHFAGSVWDRSDPTSGFSSDKLLDVVQHAYNSLGLPDPDDLEPNNPLYLVVTPPGVASGEAGAAGYHTWVNEAHDEWLDWDDVYYGWIGNNGTQDNVTTILSHEIVESLTNPRVSGGITATTAGDGELADGEAQNYAYRVNGVLLQSYWSARDGRYIVPDGNGQHLVVTSGALAVGGDQRLSDFVPDSSRDTISIDHSGNGVKVTFNGEVSQFEPNQIRSVAVFGVSGNDQIDVRQTLSNVPVTVNGGFGGDTIVVGGGDADGLRGAVNVQDSDGSDTLYFADNNTGWSDQYTITSTTIQRTTPGSPTLTRTVQYSGLGGVALLTQKGNNAITISSVNANTNYFVDGGAGTDTLVGRNVASTWKIAAANYGSVGNVGFGQVENLQGGSGADQFSFEDAGRISGSIAGGGGDDWLDYAKLTGASGVTVNLATGSATWVGSGATGKISSIEHVRGSKNGDTLTGNSSPNILIGLAGNDTLVGGMGRDILVGGGGTDTLNGDGDGDLLIGGATIHDQNNAALLAILQEWKSASSYTTRVQNLVGGTNASRLNASYFLNPTTVFDDGVADSLGGGSGTDLDLFFADYGDTFDQEAAELVL